MMFGIMTTECPNCRRLQAELKRVWAQLKEDQAKIAALEAELRRGRRQAAPFSRDEPGPDPKPPGRRPGQGQFTRRQPPSEEEIPKTHTVSLKACPDCGTPLTDRSTHPQIQIDLPPVAPGDPLLHPKRLLPQVPEKGALPSSRPGL
jgi:hypothetical protein